MIWIAINNVIHFYLSAGPLGLAKELLAEGNVPFFVLNSDITCEYSFADMIKFHKNHEKEGTIVVSSNNHVFYAI